MKYTTPQKSDKTTLARIFENAWNAEISSDVETLYSIFQTVWENIDEDPNFEEYEDLERAQLFRYYGYFLSHYGKAKNISSYQERGKNLLTKAIDLFSHLNLAEKATEAEIILGLCYFYEGAIEESEAIFNHISDLFKTNQLHPLYLRTQLNSTLILQWKGEYQKALKIIEEIEIPMEFCKDARLLTIYYTQAGLIYRGIHQYDLAVDYYNKSIEVSQQENNWLVVGKNHNNLAFLYKILGKFDLAHFHVEQAISIAQEFKYAGWLPHFLDTKAIICLEERDFQNALETIEESVSLFQKGEDYAGLTDALWNKVKTLLYLNRKEQAIEYFAELCRIAQIRIGNFALKRYSRLFAEVIHVKQSNSLETEVNRFKKAEIVNALRLSNHNFNEAAKILGFANLTSFTKMLNKEFPLLHRELEIPHILTTPEIKKSSEKAATEKEQHNPKKINKLELLDINILFLEKNISFSLSKIETFYLSSEIMSALFAIPEDVILATSLSDQLVAGSFVIAKRPDDKQYIFNQVLHDKSLNIFYLLNNDEPFPLEEATIIGQAVGYCSFTEVDNETLLFRPLPGKKSEILK